MLDPLEGEQPNQALEYSSLCIFLEYSGLKWSTNVNGRREVYHFLFLFFSLFSISFWHSFVWPMYLEVPFWQVFLIYFLLIKKIYHKLYFWWTHVCFEVFGCDTYIGIIKYKMYWAWWNPYREAQCIKLNSTPIRILINLFYIVLCFTSFFILSSIFVFMYLNTP